MPAGVSRERFRRRVAEGAGDGGYTELPARRPSYSNHEYSHQGRTELAELLAFLVELQGTNSGDRGRALPGGDHHPYLPPTGSGGFHHQLVGAMAGMDSTRRPEPPASCLMWRPTGIFNSSASPAPKAPVPLEIIVNPVCLCQCQLQVRPQLRGRSGLAESARWRGGPLQPVLSQLVLSAKSSDRPASSSRAPGRCRPEAPAPVGGTGIRYLQDHQAAACQAGDPAPVPPSSVGQSFTGNLLDLLGGRTGWPSADDGKAPPAAAGGFPGATRPWTAFSTSCPHHPACRLGCGAAATAGLEPQGPAFQRRPCASGTVANMDRNLRPYW